MPGSNSTPKPLVEKRKFQINKEGKDSAIVLSSKKYKYIQYYGALHILVKSRITKHLQNAESPCSH